MSATLARPASAAGRGADWLEARLRSDGAFDGCEYDLAGYYKSILTLAVCGRLEAASRCVTYVGRNLRTAAGELAVGDSKTGLGRMQRNLASYMDGWVAIGAWLLEAFELADEVARNLARLQSDRHGGVLTGAEKWAGRPRYDLATAASCGRAFLITGYREEALAAGGFLVEALAHQPDPTSGLDLSFDENWRPVGAPDPGELTYYRFDLSRTGEKVWFPAFSCAFLCELHQLSADAGHLEAAKEYFGVIRRIPEHAAGTLANGKSGWAAGLLARATGDDCYAAELATIVPNVLARQRADGEFADSIAAAAAPPRGNGGAPESPAELGRRLERTAEFSLWSAEYARFEAAGLTAERA